MSQTEDQPAIIATCQQTRFDIQEDRRSPEVSIQQLTLSILPATGKKTSKGKAKVSAKALDILVDTDLKLKGGVHYGLLGRNGTGKSITDLTQALLRAMATKVIPGLSLATRIALLQQTSEDKEKSGEVADEPAASKTRDPLDQSAVEFILANDMARNEIQAEIDLLSTGDVNVDDEGWVQIRAYRRLQYNRIQTKLAEAQKNVSLRSGARGAQARKELLILEKQVKEAKQEIYLQEPALDSPECQRELLEASELVANHQAKLDERQLFDVRAQALKILRALGFSDSMIERPLKELSGGWRMRCMLASVLIQDADIMILDEPTNFLDLLGIIWLQNYLAELITSSPKTVILVSHDRDFIDIVCEEIIILKDKSLQYFAGNLTAYEEDLDSRRQHLTQLKESQDKQIAHMEKTIAANIKAGKKSGDENKLRQAASRQKRIEDRMGMQTNERGGKFKLSRDMAGFHDSKRKAIEIPLEEKSVSMILPMAPDLRFPGPLVSLDKVTFSYARGQKAILEDTSLSVYMGSRVGIVGLNGSGKTTLIKLITQVTTPTKGMVSHHPRLKFGYYSQLAVEDLRAAGHADPAATALTTLAAKVGDAMDEGDMRALLGSFQLVGRTASDVPISKLSGGQLVRLALACIVWEHPHLLVLDEITTHLDFYTVIALGKALRAFNGAIVLVSHDRFLIRSVIEGEVELLGEESNGREDREEEEKEELCRNLYVLKAGKLKVLEHITQFEESLEKRVAKLAL